MEKSRNIPGKSVVILITNSFAALNVIHSGLLKRLNNEYHIYLISTMIRSPEIMHLNNHFTMAIELIDYKIPRENRLLSLLRRFEKMLFYSAFKIETQQIKSESERITLLTLCDLSFTFLLSKRIKIAALKALRQCIIDLFARLSDRNELSDYQFNGIISSSPLDIRENGIVNFFSRRKVRSLAMVISWDNLTSKGLINANHDYVLVWNQFMAEEFRRFYSIFDGRDKICVTGIPRFDKYFQKGLSKSTVQAKYKIPSCHKIILFATSAQKHFPSQKAITMHLAHYVEARTDITLLIRCHPDDIMENYESLKHHKNIQIWKPSKDPLSPVDQFSGWLPAFDFLDTLSEMLTICDACVQVASTVRLDAAACNKPVISIAYDGVEELPYNKSVRRLYDYSHQIPLNQLNIDTMVFSKKELFLALDEILGDSFQQQNNVNRISSFTHFTEPVAVDAVMKFIEKWLH